MPSLRHEGAPITPILTPPQRVRTLIANKTDAGLPQATRHLSFRYYLRILRGRPQRKVSVKAEDGLKRQRRYEILILEKS